MSMAAVIAGAVAVAGMVVSGARNSKARRLAANRKNFQTPAEIGKILQLAQSMQGGDTITKDFQTNQLDRAFSQTLGLSTRLGADQNDLSALFQKKIDGILQVGQEFHASNMQSFSKVFDAYSTVAANKAAEQMGADAQFKDLMAAMVGGANSAAQTGNSGLNALLAILASKKESKLYTTNHAPAVSPTP